MRLLFSAWIVLVAVSFAACASTMRVPHGTYRWDVKTLSDGFQPYGPVTASSIAILSQAPRPDPRCCGGKRAPAEQACVRVSGTVTRVKHEADGDLHIVLSDGARTMIVEVPDPRNMPVQWRARVAGARAAAERLRIGQAATATGIMFFDKAHDAKGAAVNDVELHPVLDLK